MSILLAIIITVTGSATSLQAEYGSEQSCKEGLLALQRANPGMNITGVCSAK